MRLIDAEKLAEVLNRYLAALHVQLRNNDISVGLRMGINTCLTFLNNANTIDAVPVVRCKDCEYGKEETDSCTSIIFSVTMDVRGTMATTFVVTEKGKSNEND